MGDPLLAVRIYSLSHYIALHCMPSVFRTPLVFHHRRRRRRRRCLLSNSLNHKRAHQSHSRNRFKENTTTINAWRRNRAGRMPISSDATESQSSFSKLAPLEAILFDIDGTICDSDLIHYNAFREMLQDIGFKDGVPITEEFYASKISGKHNEYLGSVLFPHWSQEEAMKFLNDKEAMFRRLAPQQLEAMNGLQKLCKWIEDRGLKRAAVTNAPRANAELMISILGLSEFFQLLVVGGECERAKPYPDPYLIALQDLKASPEHTFIFEDSTSGIKAGVAAGMPVVGVAARNPEQLLLEAGATFLIKDFDDPKLWNALEELDIASEEKEKADA